MCDHKYTFKGYDWNIESIDKGWQIIKEIAKKYNWEGYTPQFEIVSAEQMLDAYASHGMPVMYNHWSFGKHFLKDKDSYEKGKHGLAYELIVNTNPSICYMMDNNTQMMQLLVTAHAAVGHSHFFKNNYLFKEWTQPDTIVDYLIYVKRFMNNLEEEVGSVYLEKVLDALHTLGYYGIDKYKHPDHSKIKLKTKKAERVKNYKQNYDPILSGDSTVYMKKLRKKETIDSIFQHYENIFNFLITQKVSRGDGNITPENLNELLHIIGTVNQYFYPQYQTKVINEGFASFVHYTLMNDLADLGEIPPEYMLEFIESHTSVIYQPEFDKEHYNSINPYYLGFNMFMDIKRMCENPTQEDWDFMPKYCESNWIETINYIVVNYKDETFIEEFLSPALIRKLGLMRLTTDKKDSVINTSSDQRNQYHDDIRSRLASQYSWNYFFPDIKIRSCSEDVQITFKTYLNNPITVESMDEFKKCLSLFYPISMVEFFQDDTRI